MSQLLRQTYGLARSAVMYYGNPLRRRRARTLYAQFIKPQDLVFDLGAHMGDRVGIFTELGARVVALEPQPQFIKALRWIYGGHPSVTLIQAVAGAQTGTSTLYLSERTPTVSTVSRQWAESVRAAESFREVEWEREIEMPMTTLDSLIADHGLPDFCKIDVEGYEAEVLQGLSQPVRGLSIEYIPPARDIAQACIDRLDALGDYQFNVATGESHRLMFDDWCDSATLKAWLDQLDINDPSGDIYARLNQRCAD